MKHLQSVFSQKLGIDALFYLTEDDFSSQRFLYAGIDQFKELLEMKKAGMYDFETVLLRGEDTKTLTESFIGFVLVERKKSADLKRNDTGTCLVFTPAVSDKETKNAFYEIMNEMIPIENGSSNNPIHQIDFSEKEFAEDIIEYYTDLKLSAFKESNEFIPPYDSVYSQARIEKALQTIQRVENEISSGGEFAAENRFLSKEMNVLEICCGNGMSTLALYEKEIEPLCVDINEEDICIGLSHGVLKSEKTIVMDATTLSKNIESEQFETVIGFMVGTVYEFNKNIWFSIVDEAIKMLKPNGFLMLTLREEHEAKWIAEHLKTQGISGKMIDNRDEKTNYDSWIYFAQK
jgi:Methyltransferase domain.